MSSSGAQPPLSSGSPGSWWRRLTQSRSPSPSPSRDPIRDLAFQSFQVEGPELIQQIEATWQAILQDRTPTQIQTLLRGAHTLKGAAANVELQQLQHLAHEMEDIFRALYDPEVKITPQLAGLIDQGIDGLRLSLMVALGQMQMDPTHLQQRTDPVIQQLRQMLKDHLGQEPLVLSSSELGFDLVAAVFAQEALEELQALSDLSREDPVSASTLPQIRARLETLVGIGESVDLPGFQSIARTIGQALEQHPGQSRDILQIGLQDLYQAHQQVLAGDRSQGGQPSSQLRLFLEESPPAPDPADWSEPSSCLDLNQLLGGSEQLEKTDSPPSSQQPKDADLFLDELSLPTRTPAEVAVAPRPQRSEPSSPSSTPSLDGTSRRWCEPPRAEPVLGNTVRVDVSCLERLSHAIGELMLTQNRQLALDEHLEHILPLLASAVHHQHRFLKQVQTWSRYALGKLTPTPQRQLVPGIETFSPSPQIPSSPVIDPLKLHSQIQIAQAALAQLEDALRSLETLSFNSNQALTQQRRLVDQCRDDLLEARMQPIAKVFHRFPRLIQTLSQSYGKPVDLDLQGSEVLVDKAVMEKLYDPLLHLLRNAFDHGIESPDQRQARGKPRTGQIQLWASQQGNRIVIEVKDDGAGIDLDRIRQRALAGGWIRSPQQLSDDQAKELIFAPNFSTATQISDLSGRGVGLDVVKAQITALQGRLSLTTQPGQGTTFTLQIPLSLTTAELMVVQVGEHRIGLLATDILQVIQPQPHQIKQIQGQRVWKGDDILIPIYALADWLSYGRPVWFSLRSQPQDSTPAPLLLLQLPTTVIALATDQVLDRQDFVIRPITPTLTGPDYLCGCTLSSDGQPMMILDPVIWAQQFQPHTSSAPVPTAAPLPSLPPSAAAAEIPKLPTVLVVDDSPSVRQTVELILVREGYRVLSATQGREALEILRHHTELDLILSDLDMPEMNGIELLRAHRPTPDSQRIPFVLLTSQTEVRYRQLAFSLGVEAYLSKPLVEAELLATLERLLPNPRQTPADTGEGMG